MNKVAAFALRRKNSILSMSEKMFCPPQPLRFWITPAYTGKRIKLRKRHSICGDHPRVCEEKNFLLLMTSRRSGSPPRMRGKAGLSHGCLVLVGITPACAGKRRRTFAPNVCQGDHPCVCGEKSKLFPVDDAVKGSPPRVRGKVKVGLFVGHSVRITPACAGKRSRSILRS